MVDLTGKTALVTGSVSGIGFAVAEQFAKAGARIGVHGLASADEIKEACAALEAAGAPEAKFFEGNLLNVYEINKMMDEVAAWGGADILVNNAGIQHTASIEDMPAEKWDAIIAINLSACFHTMKAALPKMAEKGFGRVINIASVHGLVASKEKTPYVAAKFGLVGMSKVAALEYAAESDAAKGGITVNCICPGWVETALIEPQIMGRAEKHGGDRDKGVFDLVSEKQPSGRLTAPSEIGAVALWLCAREAHNLTGTAIPVDGGWTAQ